MNFSCNKIRGLYQAPSQLPESMILLFQMPVNCSEAVESSQSGFESWLCDSFVIVHKLLKLPEPQVLKCKTEIVIPILNIKRIK